MSDNALFAELFRLDSEPVIACDALPIVDVAVCLAPESTFDTEEPILEDILLEPPELLLDAVLELLEPERELDEPDNLLLTVDAAFEAELVAEETAEEAACLALFNALLTSFHDRSSSGLSG